jgi:DNA-binding protein HU-beta
VNKADVVDRVAQAAGVARQQVQGVLDAFFDTVKSAVREGDRVGWPTFGAFSLSERKARTGRNPRTGEAVDIPASKAVKFTAGSGLKAYLNPPPPARKARAKKAGAAGAKKVAPRRRSSDAQKSTASSRDAASWSAGKAPVKKAPGRKR